MKEYPKVWKFESLDLFYQHHSEILVCQSVWLVRKNSVSCLGKHSVVGECLLF